MISDQNFITRNIIQYYHNVFGKKKTRERSVDYDVLARGEYVSEEDKVKLCLPVSDSETKKAVFEIGSDKAPSADGMGAYFSRRVGQLSKGRNDCAMKIDIRKAYDSVQWDCIEEVLLGLRFPNEFIKWIMVCVRSHTLFVMINGKPEGFFTGPWGIRALKTMCDDNFSYHSGCKILKIKHMSFADDLFIFCKSEIRSIKQIARVLQHFYGVSGLQINEQKSCIYFSGVHESVKSCILMEMGFIEGTLPIKYLGVPLISKRLSKEDCNGLIEKITKRISHWTVRHLSYVVDSNR
ncbi:uncharacterized protein LOC126668754 [Mercurialis annua]|uniref:uncharacterized protein LOC126668754 n=1 Tax=Mercurialis annua TaxID=3986 RepID=UPI0021609F4D|nr:uncharacterized protein LOC126668754 [Mercurialis annua]